MSDEPNWKEKYTEMKMLHQHIEQLGEQVQQLAQNRAEIEHSKEALQDLKGSGKGELFAPIANGIFIKTELRDTEKLLVNVGSDVVVEKSVDEVVGLLSKQQDEVTKNIVKGEALLEEFHAKMMKLYQEVEAHEKEE